MGEQRDIWVNNMDLPKRKEIRLKTWNYDNEGIYFITICVKDRKHILSKVCVGGGIPDAPYIELTEYGETAKSQFETMNAMYKDMQVIYYVIMPNHIHFILELKSDGGTSGRPSPTRSNSRTSSYIGTFKRFTNKKRNIELWQRSYYDHIIRNEADYIEKRQYIENNPATWRDDEYFNQ